MRGVKDAQDVVLHEHAMTLSTAATAPTKMHPVLGTVREVLKGHLYRGDGSPCLACGVGVSVYGRECPKRPRSWFVVTCRQPLPYYA